MRIRPLSALHRWQTCALALVLGFLPDWVQAQLICPFAVTGAASVRYTADGTVLARYAALTRGSALSAGAAPTSDSAAVELALGAVANTRLDLDGDGVFTANDALIAARHLAGFSSASWLDGITLSSSATRRSGADIAAFIAQGCPAPTLSEDFESARFLTQASFGPTMASITAMRGKTATQWVNEQLAKPLHNPSHWKYVAIDRGPKGDSAFINSVMESFWSQAVRGDDQLRQRLVFALSQIFVVSTVNSAVDIQETAHASYLDTLSRNAFGNFRTLLEEVSIHPTMAIYLSWFGNQKEVPGGRQPDENYAREVMQLFTIGLWQLNLDGTRKLDTSGKPIATYNQSDIKGMARVFTGWAWGQNPNPTPEPLYFEYPPIRWDLLMQPYAGEHSSSEKRIINGVVIPPNTGPRASLAIALDTLFNHPNVGPFIGSQLIKRFVTSNPSKAYVARVATAFNNNGAGVRGDMKAVIAAVLLDPEARLPSYGMAANAGKLREPIVRYANFMRAFDVKTELPIVYRIWNLEDPIDSIGQNPLRSPSVFNWYRPDYAPPGAILSQGLVAPEFQIAHETTVTGYTNFITYVAENSTESARIIMSNYGPVGEYLAGDVSAELALADNPDALIDRLNLLLLYGRITPTLRATVKQAINNIPLADNRARDSRVATATALIMASPQFVVQK